MFARLLGELIILAFVLYGVWSLIQHVYVREKTDRFVTREVYDNETGEYITELVDLERNKNEF